MTASRIRWVAGIALALSCAVFALGAAARLSGYEVWDDGLMFSRYAENLARDGQIAWNPAEFGGKPTWGLTSLGHLAWVSVARALFRSFGGDALSWAVVSSWLAGWAFLVLVLWAAWRRDRDVTSEARLGLLAWTAVCLAVGFHSVGAHFGTGMDTATALVWLVAFLILARRLEQRPDLRTAVLTSLVAGLMFFVRPDATLFPALVLLAVVLSAFASLKAGRRDRSALVLTVGAASGAALLGGVTLLLARFYFGTWLPLPFYVKSGHHYGDAFAAEYAGVAAMELGLFALAFCLPLLAVLLDLLPSPRRWWRALSAVEKGLAIAIVGFGAYHLTQVAPIMGGGQRFYQPMLPALLWLSWGSVLRLRRGRFSNRKAARMAVCFSVTALLAVSLGAETLRLRETLARESWPALDLETAYQRRAHHYWPALDVVATLPPEALVAATEVGLPGAMNPGKVVLDLAGLHDPDFALRGFSADRVFQTSGVEARRPDVVYLPHPHYEEMLRELTEHPTFQAEYRVWTAEELRSVLGVAVRRGSAAEEPMANALEGAIGARSRR